MTAISRSDAGAMTPARRAYREAMLARQDWWDANCEYFMREYPGRWLLLFGPDRWKLLDDPRGVFDAEQDESDDLHSAMVIHLQHDPPPRPL